MTESEATFLAFLMAILLIMAAIGLVVFGVEIGRSGQRSSQTNIVFGQQTIIDQSTNTTVQTITIDGNVYTEWYGDCEIDGRNGGMLWSRCFPFD